MKKVLVLTICGAILSVPVLASALPIVCRACGKMMIPGTWHKCEQNKNH